MDLETTPFGEPQQPPQPPAGTPRQEPPDQQPPPPGQPPLAPPGATPDPPAIDRLDGRVVPYWILVNLITTLVLGVGVAVGVAWLRGRDADNAHWYLWGGAGFAGLLLLVSFLQPVLAYATWRYSMDDELLVARYGILFREEKTIPVSRLQHVDLRRGPIERLFSLATLVVFTAGTEGASFRVPGLTVDRAREMRDRILAARGDDVI